MSNNNGGSFPRPYVNSVAQDDSIAHYVRDGDFSKTDIGSRNSGMPDRAKSERMNIDHVGGNIGNSNWGAK